MLPSRFSQLSTIKIKGIKTVPFTLFMFLLIVGCSAMINKFNPTVVEKTTVILKTDTLKIRDTIKVKVYPIKKMIAESLSKIETYNSNSNSNSNFKVKTLYGYTPYQIMMWHLKAHESFRPTKYADGEYHSIGFGLNLSPEHKKFASKELRDGKFTWEEGINVTQRYIENYIFPELDKKFPKATPFQKVALAVHKYNTGNTRNLNGCCGISIGCGSKNKNIRKSHNARRNFEWRLYNGKISKKEIEADKLKASILDRKWK